jgi:hypothetical protein
MPVLLTGVKKKFLCAEFLPLMLQAITLMRARACCSTIRLFRFSCYCAMASCGV